MNVIKSKITKTPVIHQLKEASEMRDLKSIEEDSVKTIINYEDIINDQSSS